MKCLRHTDNKRKKMAGRLYLKSDFVKRQEDPFISHFNFYTAMGRRLLVVCEPHFPPVQAGVELEWDKE